MDKLLAVATLGPIGYAPFSGTLASLVAFVILCPFRFLSFPLFVLITISGLVLGYYAITYALDFFKHRDPSIIVYDEVIGVMVLLCTIPATLVSAFLGLWLFRLFDGSKILGISLFEKIKGVWGVILDDIVAALYASALVSIAATYGFL